MLSLKHTATVKNVNITKKNILRGRDENGNRLISRLGVINLKVEKEKKIKTRKSNKQANQVHH